MVESISVCVHTNVRYMTNLLSGDMVRMHLSGPLAAIFIMMNVSPTAIVGDR